MTTAPNTMLVSRTWMACASTGRPLSSRRLAAFVLALVSSVADLATTGAVLSVHPTSAAARITARVAHTKVRVFFDRVGILLSPNRAHLSPNEKKGKAGALAGKTR